MGVKGGLFDFRYNNYMQKFNNYANEVAKNFSNINKLINIINREANKSGIRGYTLQGMIDAIEYWSSEEDAETYALLIFSVWVLVRNVCSNAGNAIQDELGDKD